MHFKPIVLISFLLLAGMAGGCRQSGSASTPKFHVLVYQMKGGMSGLVSFSHTFRTADVCIEPPPLDSRDVYRNHLVTPEQTKHIYGILKEAGYFSMKPRRTNSSSSDLHEIMIDVWGAGKSRKVQSFTREPENDAVYQLGQRIVEYVTADVSEVSAGGE